MVLITGAAQGIGAACASFFTEAGARVALFDVDAELGALAPDGASLPEDGKVCPEEEAFSLCNRSLRC